MNSGTSLNYPCMVLDFSRLGETQVSVKGFVEDMLLSSGVTGGAKTPAADGLFEVKADTPQCSEARRKEFHSLVAKTLYLADRPRSQDRSAWRHE
jgi:hypothetical protein